MTVEMVSDMDEVVERMDLIHRDLNVISTPYRQTLDSTYLFVDDL